MAVLAVDLGGTWLRTLLFHSGRDAGEQLTVAVPREADGGLSLSGLVALLKDRCREGSRRYAVEALGVSIAGTVDAQRRTVVRALNLKMAELPLAALLEQELGLPVVLETDSFSAGLAETRMGAGAGLDPVLFITVGTGIGHAVVSGGNVLRGACSGASVFGHICVEPGGTQCYCGRRGCVCMYASGRGLESLAHAAGHRAGGAEVSLAASAGDSWAQDILRVSDSYLARALAMAMSLVNPQRVVINGAAFGPDPERFARLAALVGELVHASVHPIDIVPGRFPDTAALLGAGLMAEKNE